MIQPGQLVVLEAQTHAEGKPLTVNPRHESHAAIPAKIVFLHWLDGKNPTWHKILCKDSQGTVFTMRRRAKP